MTAAHTHAPPRVRHVTYTDLVLSLLAREPKGLTSAQIGLALGITSDGAGRVAAYLFKLGRITREVRFPPSGRVPQFCIWKAKA